MNKGEIKQNKGKKGKNEDRTVYKEKILKVIPMNRKK